MIDQSTKCDPEILFKITKKEAEFVFKLPRSLQDEFEEYQKLKYKFHCLLNSNSKIIDHIHQHFTTYNSLRRYQDFLEKRDIFSTISSSCALTD
jgi:hypothetical protein